jgi:predicted ferric reductase
MEPNLSQPVNIEEVKPSFNLGGFAILMLAAFLGALAAAILLPNWMPALTQSVAGADPKAFWYLSRGSAFVAYTLLWLSMILGTGITNKLSVLWPGLPPTIEIHQFASILGLAFGLFHGLILMGDHFMAFSLTQVLIPFANSGYKPLAVGIGQVGFYTMLIVTLSFYIRKKIGPNTWRAIHFVSFATFVSVLVHALLAGTDASAIGTQIFYLITSALLLFMILNRIMVSSANAREKKLRMQAVPPKIPTR